MVSGTPGQWWRCGNSYSGLPYGFQGFTGAASQVTGYKTLFTKLGFWDKLQLLLFYQPQYYISISLPELLDSISGLAMALKVLGDFNLPSLAVESEVAQEIMVTMTTMGLFQIFQHLTWKQWSHNGSGVPVRGYVI